MSCGSRELHGEAHADVLGNLGLVAYYSGDYDAAEAYLSRTLVINEGTLGSQHAATGATLANLANVSTARGRHDEARARLERALQISEAGLGPDHPQTAGLRTNLASEVGRTGDLQRAIAMHEQAVEALRNADGGPHPYLINALIGLAAAVEKKGEFRDALTHAEEARAMMEASSPDHPSRYVAEEAVAKLQLRLGRHQEAAQRFRRALTLSMKLYGETHANTLGSRLGLADVALARGDRKQAVTLLAAAARLEGLGDATRHDVRTRLRKAGGAP